VLVWLSVWSEVHTCICPSYVTAAHCLLLLALKWPIVCWCAVKKLLTLASVKSRLVLPFWYRLTWVVPEKGPLNGCVCARAYFKRFRIYSQIVIISAAGILAETVNLAILSRHAVRRKIYFDRRMSVTLSVHNTFDLTQSVISSSRR